MTESSEITTDMRQLRFRFAINFFKALLLGDKHVPGKPQTESVFDALSVLSQRPPVSDRAWHDWFCKPERIPQPKKIQALDQLANLLPATDCTPQCLGGPIPQGFFTELVHGGLMQSLVIPTKSKNLQHTLLGRANNYQPLSAIHLHFDAIETASWIDSYQALPWTAPVAVAAQRTLELLHERWSPRHGSLYATFRSDLGIKWDRADAEEKTEIKKSWARFRPNPFERLMQAGASPNWTQCGCESDAPPNHIYKLLLSLAADSCFLVEDRLQAWGLDLATAALAMHALAWTDRYNTMGELTNELFFWNAFDAIYFDDEPLETDDWNLLPAMARCSAEWNEASVGLFSSARELYRSMFAECGISVNEVNSVAMRARETYPLSYRGTK